MRRNTSALEANNFASLKDHKSCPAPPPESYSLDTWDKNKAPHSKSSYRTHTEFVDHFNIILPGMFSLIIKDKPSA